jgi:hypothetical protein
VYRGIVNAGVIVAVQAAAAARRRAIQAADSAWQPYAQARGMHHVVGRAGWAHTQLPRVEGVLEGISVALELVATSAYHTAALALPATVVPGNVEVIREGLMQKLSKAFGAQDIVVGDEAFDRAFLVQATSAATARAVLSPDVCRAILEIGACRVAYDDGTEQGHVAMVFLEVPSVLTDSHQLDRALRTAVAIARTRIPETPYR